MGFRIDIDIETETDDEMSDILSRISLNILQGCKSGYIEGYNNMRHVNWELVDTDPANNIDHGG